LLYVAHDLGFGMGWAIILVSLGLRSVFLPLIGATQLNAVKMKLLEPEMKNFQNTMSKFQRAGDFKGTREARKQFAALRERYGINNFLPFLSLSQIPVLITWFLSLRYVANTPDKFPSVKTDGFLWFQDLSAYDPYFVLPIISACVSYHNIQLSTMNATSAIGGPFARYTRYFKYFPFLTIPFVGFFPAALNIYWITTALVQLLITMSVRSTALRSMMGIPEYLPGSILEKLHGVKKPDIVKTVFTVDKTVEDVVNSTTQTSSKAEPTIQAKVPPTTTTQKSSGPQKTVEVFTHKPKKPKN
jgi:YidC/Oxa1 family membrane protein insertase